MVQTPESPSPEHPQTASYSFFGTPRYLPLFLVQFTGAFNGNFFKNAFVILATFHFALERNWNAEVIAQIIAALFVLPYFIFSAVAGQLADKLEKARIVRITKIWEIIALTFGSMAILMDNPWMLFATIFMLGAQAAFFDPLKYSLLPQHLRGDELLGGNAIFEAATYIAIIGGTLLGELLISLPHGRLYVSAGLLACAVAGWVASRFVPAAHSAAPELKINANVFTATAELIWFTARRKGIFLTILGISWVRFIGVFFITLTPAYVTIQLGSQSWAVTVTILCAFAIGVGIGALICTHLLHGEASVKFVPLSGIAMSLFIADIAWLIVGLAERYTGGEAVFTFFSFTGGRLLVDLLGMSICGGIFSVPLFALMQIWSPPTHRSRVIATNNIINMIFIVAGSIVVATLFWAGCKAWELIMLIAITNLIIALYVITSKSKKATIVLTCVLCVMLVFFIGSATSSPVGSYQRTDTYYGGNNYTSTITVNKDGTIVAEIRTGFGAVDRTGTYTLNKTGLGEWDLDVVWNSTKFYNTLGERPDLSDRQTFHVDGKGISIGKTIYTRSK